MESREDQIERETRRLRAFQWEADEISRLILNTDLPWIDIEIQIEKLRQRAALLFPRKTQLFELIYVSRFRRLWEQWREGGEALPAFEDDGQEPTFGDGAPADADH
jgi:hypothetical protein